jgi:hypothetical protein
MCAPHCAAPCGHTHSHLHLPLCRSRSILFNRLASVSGDEDGQVPCPPESNRGTDHDLIAASADCVPPRKPSSVASLGCAAQHPHSLGGSKNASSTGAPSAPHAAPQQTGHGPSFGGACSNTATSQGAARIREISSTLQGGAPTAQTLERVRSINKGVQRSMDNVMG